MMVFVSISYGNNPTQTLKDSLENLGGIHKFIHKNQTIFIKPDLTLPLGPPVTIQPQLLGYLVKLCLDAGAKKVYIGFNPFDGVSSKQLSKLLGLDYYLTALGGTLLNLEEEPFSKTTISNPIQFKTLYVPDKLLKSEIFISLVAPRADVYCGYALGLHNYFDLLNDNQKQELIQSGSSHGLLDYFKVKPPQLTVWDAFTVGEGQGPFNLRAVAYNLILSSPDLLAGDAIIRYLMGINLSRNDLLNTIDQSPSPLSDLSNYDIQGKNLHYYRKLIKLSKLSVEVPSEDFEVIEGKTCPGCQIFLTYWRDFLLRFIKKDLKEFGGFSCFVGEFPTDSEYELKNGIIFFGKCAISSNLPIYFRKKHQKKQYIFQFQGCPPISLRTLEHFCIKFKEWLPSLELVEEFIRKWTIERQFSSYK